MRRGQIRLGANHRTTLPERSERPLAIESGGWLIHNLDGCRLTVEKAGGGDGLRLRGLQATSPESEIARRCGRS
jgi:hypothetical protein